MKSRRENVKRAVSVGRNGETPVKPYEHTAIWRFGVSGRNGGAIRVCSRLFMNDAR